MNKSKMLNKLCEETQEKFFLESLGDLEESLNNAIECFKENKKEIFRKNREVMEEIIDSSLDASEAAVLTCSISMLTALDFFSTFSSKMLTLYKEKLDSGAIRKSYLDVLNKELKKREKKNESN